MIDGDEKIEEWVCLIHACMSGHGRNYHGIEHVFDISEEADAMIEFAAGDGATQVSFQDFQRVIAQIQGQNHEALKSKNDDDDDDDEDFSDDDEENKKESQ